MTQTLDKNGKVIAGRQHVFCNVGFVLGCLHFFFFLLFGGCVLICVFCPVFFVNRFSSLCRYGNVLPLNLNHACIPYFFLPCLQYRYFEVSSHKIFQFVRHPFALVIDKNMFSMTCCVVLVQVPKFWVKLLFFKIHKHRNGRNFKSYVQLLSGSGNLY
jgi:hypothetical protein